MLVPHPEKARAIPPETGFDRIIMKMCADRRLLHGRHLMWRTSDGQSRGRTAAHQLQDRNITPCELKSDWHQHPWTEKLSKDTASEAATFMRSKQSSDVTMQTAPTAALQ